jgi:hypothetical protein
MQLAAKLLDEGVDIADAVAQVGYASPATSIARSSVGATPGAWRKAKRKIVIVQRERE